MRLFATILFVFCLSGCATPEVPEPGDRTLAPWGYQDMIEREPDSIFAPEGDQ